MNSRTPAEGICFGRKSNIGWPQLSIPILYLDCLVVLNGARELQIQIISNAQIPVLKRRIKHSTFKPHILNGDLFAIRYYSKLVRPRQTTLSVSTYKIPLLGFFSAWLDCGDASQLQNRRGDNAQLI